jgi:polysaccharide export outer membrane protein
MRWLVVAHLSSSVVGNLHVASCSRGASTGVKNMMHTFGLKFTRTLSLSAAFSIILSVPSAFAQAQGTPTNPPAGTTAAPRPAAPAPAQTPARPAVPTPPPNLPAGVELPPGYVIGTDDVLSVIYWREKDMSSDVVVRPDGKISLPLLNEVDAAGITPAQLRDKVEELSKRFVEEPSVSIIVKAINSRKVFITGMINKPGPYPITGPMTVIQLIATAGGVQEYANSSKIVILRYEKGQAKTFRFNYNDVVNQKNLAQNIELKPGDSVMVP